jgi:hypothetical protein
MAKQQQEYINNSDSLHSPNGSMGSLTANRIYPTCCHRAQGAKVSKITVAVADIKFEN